MNYDLYKNIIGAYKESGPFYISKNPKIKIGESDFHGTSYFVVYTDSGIIELDRLLKSVEEKGYNISSHDIRIFNKISEWNYAYKLKKEYFNN